MSYSSFKFRPVLGLCGCGKSKFMDDLGRAGRQVLDFEKLIGIQGACLAPVTFDKQVDEFKEQIDQHLRGLDAKKVIYVEWKSPLVLGHPLPIDLVSAIRLARPIALVQPSEARVQNLLEKYEIWTEHLDLVLKKIEDRGAPRELIQDLSNLTEPRAFVQSLLFWLDQEYLIEIDHFWSPELTTLPPKVVMDTRFDSRRALWRDGFSADQVATSRRMPLL